MASHALQTIPSSHAGGGAVSPSSRRDCQARRKISRPASAPPRSGNQRTNPATGCTHPTAPAGRVTRRDSPTVRCMGSAGRDSRAGRRAPRAAAAAGRATSSRRRRESSVDGRSRPAPAATRSSHEHSTSIMIRMSSSMSRRSGMGASRDPDTGSPPGRVPLSPMWWRSQAYRAGIAARTRATAAVHRWQNGDPSAAQAGVMVLSGPGRASPHRWSRAHRAAACSGMVLTPRVVPDSRSAPVCTTHSNKPATLREEGAGLVPGHPGTWQWARDRSDGDWRRQVLVVLVKHLPQILALRTAAELLGGEDQGKPPVETVHVRAEPLARRL